MHICRCSPIQTWWIIRLFQETRVRTSESPTRQLLRLLTHRITTHLVKRALTPANGIYSFGLLVHLLSLLKVGIGLDLAIQKKQTNKQTNKPHSEVGRNALVNMTFFGGACMPIHLTCFMLVVPLPVSNHGDEWWVTIKPTGNLQKKLN